MAHTLPPLPYADRRARTPHRQADDGDSSRQASPGLRQQPERRAREASRAAVEERRGADQRTSTPCPKTSARRCETTAAATPTTRCSGRSWARTPAARRPARSPTRSPSSFGSFDTFKEQFDEGRRRPLRQRLGVGDRQRRQARRSRAPPNQDSPLMEGKKRGVRHRRLGTRLLPEVPEPPSRLHRRLVERRQLGRDQQAAGDSGPTSWQVGQVRAQVGTSPPARSGPPAQSPSAPTWFFSSSSPISASGSSSRSCFVSREAGVKFFRFNAGLAAILIAVAFAFRPADDRRRRRRWSALVALAVAEAAIVLYWATSRPRARLDPSGASSASACGGGLVALVAQALATSRRRRDRRHRC